MSSYILIQLVQIFYISRSRDSMFSDHCFVLTIGQRARKLLKICFKRTWSIRITESITHLLLLRSKRQSSVRLRDQTHVRGFLNMVIVGELALTSPVNIWIFGFLGAMRKHITYMRERKNQQELQLIKVQKSIQEFFLMRKRNFWKKGDRKIVLGMLEDVEPKIYNSVKRMK